MPSVLIVTPVIPPSLTILAIIKDGANAEPLSVSLVNTVGVTPPVKPFMGAPEKSSSTASIGAVPTVTLAVAVSQFAGDAISQIE